METTHNYNLKKPSYDEFADVEALNENMDKIDTTLKELEDSVGNNDKLTELENEVTKHLGNDDNPHGVTAEQVGAVKKSGDTMTGPLTVPRIILANGTQIRDTFNERTLLNAHNNRFDILSQDGQKYLFRYMNGDFSAFDENGTLIDSFKGLKNKSVVYTEGTWTPILRGGITAGNPTYSRRLGRYIRINNQIYVVCEILLSNKGGMTGAIEIAGLPAVSNGDYRVATIGVTNQIQYPATAKNLAGYVSGNTIRPYFNLDGMGSVLDRVEASEVGDALLLNISAVYDI